MKHREELQDADRRMRAEAEEEEGEVWADIRSGICSFCSKPVGIETGFLELATLREGRLSYPSHDNQGGEPVAYLTHATCSPINGYWIALDRLPQELDGPHGLAAHIDRKVWRCWQYWHALHVAAALARQLRATPKRRRPKRGD